MHTRDWNLWEARWLAKTIGPLDGVLALDVGAGDGRFVGILQSQGAWAYGVDAKPRSPVIMQATFPDLSTALLLPDHFDVVCFRESLYYLDFDYAMLRVRRLLHPGGYLYIKSSAALTPHDDLTHFPDPEVYARWVQTSGFKILAERDYPKGKRPWLYADRFLLVAQKEKP